MIRVTKRWESGGIASEESATAYHYVIAGQAVVFQTKVDTLSAYEEGAASEQFSHLLKAPASIELIGGGDSKLQYQGRAQFCGKECDIHYWRKNGCAQIDINGVPICQIDYTDDQIHLLNELPFNDPLNVEVITGPALIVLLAQKSIYTLHAGAVATSAGNVAFIAESGSGKSTLSTHVDEAWSQISDDILPLTLDKKLGVKMLADFPQLKLDGAQVSAPILATENLDVLIRINPKPTEKIEFRHLDKTESLLQIVRHTVGAKLFDRAAMKRHSKFAKKTSCSLSVIEISYPRDLDKLSDLRAGIIKYLAALKA